MYFKKYTSFKATGHFLASAYQSPQTLNMHWAFACDTGGESRSKATLDSSGQPASRAFQKSSGSAVDNH